MWIKREVENALSRDHASSREPAARTSSVLTAGLHMRESHHFAAAKHHGHRVIIIDKQTRRTKAQIA
jgi:hypothetical protein